MFEHSFVNSAAALTKEVVEGVVLTLLRQNLPAVLLTIVDTHGQVARKVGTRAVLTKEFLHGTLGGGLFEAHVCEFAWDCLHKGECALYTESTLDDIGRGTRTVLCEYLYPELKELFEVALACLHEEIIGFWLVNITDSSSPSRTFVCMEEPSVKPENWDQLLSKQWIIVDSSMVKKFFREYKKKPKIFRISEQRFYFEPLKMPPILLLCGGGYVARETALLSSHCGFLVDVVDDREECATHELFPMARQLLCLPDFNDLVKNCRIGSRHSVVIATHSHEMDACVLRQVLLSHAAYIGMLANSLNKQAIFAQLQKEGIPTAELAAVHSPIGLQIGSETPQEIAVSIVAELIAVRKGVVRRER